VIFKIATWAMQLDNAEHVQQYLVDKSLVGLNEKMLIQQIPGGVSCFVWHIETPSQNWVIKQARSKLDVEADWYSDTDRIHREHQAMSGLSAFMKDKSIPKVLHVDDENHVYMMEFIEDACTWKEMLMAGIFDEVVAANAAHLLQQIHAAAPRIGSTISKELEDQKYFIQLRIEPFHRSVMVKHPNLTLPIQKLIEELTTKKVSLVHGDFSPKNMLVKKDGSMVLIDFEVIHWGNPVFDLAYCVGHLMLKGWHLKRQTDSLRLIEVFLKPFDYSTIDLLPHLGLMLLARVDGRSPVSYIKEESQKNLIRETGIHWINHHFESKNVLENIRGALST
jgi:aminoglycoside phosphotransferase (APT) family kinase protein